MNSFNVRTANGEKHKVSVFNFHPFWSFYENKRSNYKEAKVGFYKFHVDWSLKYFITHRPRDGVSKKPVSFKDLHNPGLNRFSQQFMKNFVNYLVFCLCKKTYFTWQIIKNSLFLLPGVNICLCALQTGLERFPKGGHFGQRFGNDLPSVFGWKICLNSINLKCC